jgi:probable HAF family extracellular repeat protein
MISLGYFPGGREESSAWGINSIGQVVGYGTAATGYRAFLWTPAESNGLEGNMVDLGTLPDEKESWGSDINSKGQVVGYSSDAVVGWPGRAFLWTPTTPNADSGTMIDLNSVIEPSIAAEWTLRHATAINDRGQIVGYAVHDPDGPGEIPPVARGFLLTPIPEPMSALLAGLGAMLFATFVRTRKSSTL